MGGDWFDVIALPGARVALVVGDVVGHGLHAAATMGRLRTAVHNFSTLDLPPDELLGHLDELVNRIDQEPTAHDGGAAVTGATCLYAVYDPASRRCALARAGHPPPALVHPDGTVEYPDLPAGPPLGLATMPFEATELELAEGSRLVLYTDGLIEDRNRDIDTGLERLRTVLTGAGPDTGGDLPRPCSTRSCRRTSATTSRCWSPVPGCCRRTGSPTGTCRPTRRRWPTSAPRSPGSSTDWGLTEVAFTTELILSELITNAIRYASGPIRVRLLRDRKLICEVSDASSTAPHLRYAAGLDEGGRGLFLVAQFAERWGTRYTATGKIIWTEQPLD